VYQRLKEHQSNGVVDDRLAKDQVKEVGLVSSMEKVVLELVDPFNI
jgi:hypothetical protein